MLYLDVVRLRFTVLGYIHRGHPQWLWHDVRLFSGDAVALAVFRGHFHPYFSVIFQKEFFPNKSSVSGPVAVFRLSRL